jgi:hypothetical protein
MRVKGGSNIKDKTRLKGENALAYFGGMTVTKK